MIWIAGMPPPQALKHRLLFRVPVKRNLTNICVADDLRASFPLLEPLLMMKYGFAQRILALLQPALQKVRSPYCTADDVFSHM